MPYDHTPVEPIPQTSAYDHLPPYTSLAPSSTAPPPTAPAPTMAADATVRLPDNSWRWGVVLLVAFIFGVKVLAGIQNPTTMPSFTFPSLASASTFYVIMPDGWTSRPPSGPGLVVTMSSLDESLTVWSAPVDTTSCIKVLAQQSAKIPGTRAVAEAPSLDGSPASGYKVTSPPTEHTLACTERNGTRYVVHHTQTGSTSSFAEIAKGWHWR